MVRFPPLRLPTTEATTNWGLSKAGRRHERAHIQFAAFVDGTWSFRCAMTADAAGKRELLEELLETFFVLTLFRINLGIGSFKIRWTQFAWCAMTGASHENHVQIVLLDKST